MHLPRRRVTRSGPAQQVLRRSLTTTAAAVIALVLAACGSVVAPTGSTPQVQAVEAETAAVLSGALVVREDPEASGGAVVVRPAGAGAADAVTGPEARAAFTASASGHYVLWARLKAASEQQNEVYLGFDDALERVEVRTYGTYVWTVAAVADLEAGEHELSIASAEPEVEVDTLVVATRDDLTAEALERFVLHGEEPTEQPGPGTGTPNEPEGPRQPETTPGAPVPATGRFDLRGDPDFDPSRLPAEARVWYDRTWAAIEGGGVIDAYALARSDDLYKYGRDLHTHVQFLLHAFRATGDLRFLDEVDHIAELMRSKLADSWRGVLVGSAAEGKDGYLNWVWRYSSGDSYVGKDTNELDEIKTHALVASIAYALELNRDLKSPGGRAYGAHADFWKDYLVNHFEAKWRERKNKPTGFPIMIRPHTHTYYSWAKWHYYMALLTGDDAYMREAVRMAGELRKDFKHVTADGLPAAVWPKSVLSEGGSLDYLHPTVYARYVYHDAIEFYWEGFGWWDDDVLTRMAHVFAAWVIDEEHATGSKDWFAGDIGGDTARAGYYTDGWARMTYNRFEVSAYAEIAPWDTTGLIDEYIDKTTDKVGGVGKTRYIAFPVSKLIAAMLAAQD